MGNKQQLFNPPREAKEERKGFLQAPLPLTKTSEGTVASPYQALSQASMTYYAPSPGAHPILYAVTSFREESQAEEETEGAEAEGASTDNNNETGPFVNTISGRYPTFDPSQSITPPGTRVRVQLIKEETAAEVYVISSMQGPSNLPDGSSIRRSVTPAPQFDSSGKTSHAPRSSLDHAMTFQEKNG